MAGMGQNMQAVNAPVNIGAGVMNIPGFVPIDDRKRPNSTQFSDLGELERTTAALIASLPNYQFDLEDIKRRNGQRRTIASRIDTLVFNFTVAKRKLALEHSMLEETKQVDQNVLAVQKERATVEQLTDPVGVRERNAAKRQKAREEQAEWAALEERQAKLNQPFQNVYDQGMVDEVN